MSLPSSNEKYNFSQKINASLRMMDMAEVC